MVVEWIGQYPRARDTLRAWGRTWKVVRTLRVDTPEGPRHLVFLRADSPRATRLHVARLYPAREVAGAPDAGWCMSEPKKTF